MTEVVIKHVKVEALPQDWRDLLTTSAEGLVTVRIEQEADLPVADARFVTDDPAFGIWRDRDDITDVEAHVHRLRAARYGQGGPAAEP